MERLGVDIGGTFVDAVHFDRDEDRLVLQKASTTPTDPIVGVGDAIDKIDPDLSDVSTFVHGTTLGLNAILERDGADTGIITNEGFIDVFEIGRLNRPFDEMFNPRYKKPDPLIPRFKRKGVEGRIDSHGAIVEPLDLEGVADAAEELIEEHDVTSIGICLLHSYQNAEHERAIADLVTETYPEVSVSLSSDLTREYREYERTSTAVLDAYIKPIFQSYTDKLAGQLRDDGFGGTFYITRSGGGSLAVDAAKEMPVHTVLSGPAGGIIGAAQIGTESGYDNIIAADIGGTSTDTCVIQEGAPIIEHESDIGRHPMLIPAYDIRTIGAGGGSIAWLDDQLLKVGPRSAGAEPGPICYGRGGTEPTVTDAAVIHGYISPDRFLGGEMELAVEEARDGLRTELADPLGMDVEGVCEGIFDVLTADIVTAISEITVERGLDPREFSILAYGGAGPLIMPFVARELDVQSVIVPPAPSVFSAWGMLLSNVVYDFSQTTTAALRDLSMADVESVFAELEEESVGTLAEEGFDEDRRTFERSAEMRYIGQEHTVEVPCNDVDSTDDFEGTFHDLHERRYGHKMDNPTEIVHMRVRAIGRTDKAHITESTELELASADGGEAPDGETRTAYCAAVDEPVAFDIYQRRTLSTDAVVEGPAIIEEPANTIVVFSDQEATIDALRNLVITPRGGTQ